MKDVTVTATDGALDLAVFAAAPRLSTGFLIPELRGGLGVPGLRGPCGRGFTSPDTLCVSECVGKSQIVRHTTALLRQENGTDAIIKRRYIEKPEKTSRPSLIHSSPAVSAEYALDMLKILGIHYNIAKYPLTASLNRLKHLHLQTFKQLIEL